MMNITPANYQPNRCKPVYKFNLEGELVHTYLRTIDAMKGEHITGSKLKELTKSRMAFRGYIFSMSPDIDAVVREDDNTTASDDEMPWESNGMFDISGWGKVCL